MIIGMETMIWDKISGGVMMADIINITTIACLRYFFKKSGVIRPIWVRKKLAMGSKNNSPV